jgi:tetratricopeptide (TPR) repeat protein
VIHFLLRLRGSGQFASIITSRKGTVMRKPASSFTFVLICFASISLATAGTNDAGRDTFVDDYYQRTVSLLASESYPEISEILDKMRETKLIGANGKRQLEAVYDELKTIEDTELLNQWCQGSNSSHYPFVVRGNFYLHQAQSYTHSFDTNISGLANNKRFNQYLNAAQDDIEKAHQLDPLDPSSSSAMITISMLRGYPKSVMEEWFNKAVTTDPLWISAYKNKLRYLSPNRYGSDKEMYNFAVSQTENSPPGSSVYSVLFEYFDILNTHHYPVEQDLFFSLNLPSKAHKLFHPTIEKFKTDFPDSSIPTLYDGKYKFLQAEPDTAETLFTYILLKEPENIDALQSRALGYMQKKEWKKAEIDLEKLLRQTSNSAFALSNLRAISALLNEDIKSMKDFYAKAIELEKSSYMAKLYYLDLAVLLDRKKDYEEAIKAYDQALKIQPGFGRALLGRAESKHKSGKTEAAIEDLLIVINTGSRYKDTAEQRIE